MKACLTRHDIKLWKNPLVERESPNTGESSLSSLSIPNKGNESWVILLDVHLQLEFLLNWPLDFRYSG